MFLTFVWSHIAQDPEPLRFAFAYFLCQAKEQNNYGIWIILTFSCKMINNLSSICYLNQELLTAESSACTLIQCRCRQFVLINIATKTQFTPEVKLIHPLDFQLCVSASILVEASLPFASQRQGEIALLSAPYDRNSCFKN